MADSDFTAFCTEVLLKSIAIKLELKVLQYQNQYWLGKVSLPILKKYCNNYCNTGNTSILTTLGLGLELWLGL